MTAFEWWRALYARQGRRALGVVIYQPRMGGYGGVERESLVFLGKEPTDWKDFCAKAAAEGTDKVPCEVGVNSSDFPFHYAFVDFSGREPDPWKRRAILRTHFPELGDWTFFDSGRSFHAVAEHGLQFNPKNDHKGERVLAEYLQKLRSIPELKVDVGWTHASQDDGYCLLRLSCNGKFHHEPELIVP